MVVFSLLQAKNKTRLDSVETSLDFYSGANDGD